MMGFNNIIGHEEIIGHLKNAIESGKISHSYIFTGEPGSGKKLLAGTFAATLQCEAGGTEPCQKCDSCKKAMGKNHPDIIMVSHEKPGTITIDEIRDQVINDIDIRPYYSPYKIYIISQQENHCICIFLWINVIFADRANGHQRTGSCIYEFISTFYLLCDP